QAPRSPTPARRTGTTSTGVSVLAARRVLLAARTELLAAWAGRGTGHKPRVTQMSRCRLPAVADSYARNRIRVRARNPADHRASVRPPRSACRTPPLTGEDHRGPALRA